jgi:hypothetical protein
VNPRILLHLEGAALLVLSILLYQHTRASWWQFLILFMAPDVSILGYLVNARVGAVTYNAIHTYIGPILLAMYLIAALRPELLSFAVIWLAHIGFDRMLGFGLKYQNGFRDTHLNPVRHAQQIPTKR